VTRFRVNYFADNLAVSRLLHDADARPVGRIQAGTAEAEIDVERARDYLAVDR